MVNTHALSGQFHASVAMDAGGDFVVADAFGFRGATLVTGAVNLAGCTRCDAAAIGSYLAGIS